ncbi:MAG: family 1 glycosylhydrolase [Candidatus Hodarchaeota archaeon]
MSFLLKKKSIQRTIQAANTLLKMHALAYRIIKEVDPNTNAGLVKNMIVFKPANPKSRQERIASKIADYHFNGAILRALRTGKPVRRIMRRDRQLKSSSDFLGLNYYQFGLVSRKNQEFVANSTLKANPKHLCTGLGWEPYPEGLLINLRRIQREFPKLPIYITENGIGTDDDGWRQQQLIDHLKMTHQAIQEGIDVRGYFHWSLLDNFEWVHGTESLFGLIHVNYDTQQRTIKESGYLYADIAKNNALTSEILAKFPREGYSPKFSL